MRILVIEDDLEAAAYVVKGLKESGHIVDHAADGEEGLTLALSGSFDVMIVDRMLPKRDGLSVVETLREEGNRTPAPFLPARGAVGGARGECRRTAGRRRAEGERGARRGCSGGAGGR